MASGVLRQIEEAGRLVRAAVASIDASAVSGEDAERLVAALSSLSRSADAGVAILARRLQETARWKHANTPSPEAHLPKLTGGSQADGRRLLDTSKRLEGLEATKAAMERGEISTEQAGLIAAAAGEMADAGRATEAEVVEADLLGVAQRGNFGALRTAAEQVRQAARDEEAQREQRGRRGSSGSAASKTVGWAAPSSSSRAWPQRCTRCSTPKPSASSSWREPRAAARATTPTPPTPGSTPSAMSALRLRQLRSGVGAVPVGVIRGLLGEALLTLVLHDGVDIMNVTCTGRRGAKALRIAVGERDGWVCRTCGSPFGLENDHARPVALGGRTTYGNLKGECRICHRDKSVAEAPVTIRAGRQSAEQERLTRRRLGDLIDAAAHGPPRRG